MLIHHSHHEESEARRGNLIIIALLLLLLPTLLYAQWFGSTTEQIQSLRIIVADDWERTAIVNMAQDEEIEFSFDEMSHEYHRYTYHIEHCNAQWQPSDLLESDYLDGFNDQPIEEWENSLNTTFDYTHYSITLPNNDVRLKLSGNYRLSVRENNKEVAYFKFCMNEGAHHLSGNITGNTVMDFNGSHQQVCMTVQYGGLSISHPNQELYTVVMQNNRTDNAVYNPTPTYDNGRQLTYEHSEQLTFTAGNEYRRFEILNMYSSVLNVDHISYHNPYYHATILQDRPLHAYRFDNDHNGRFLIRHEQLSDSDTRADYLFVHFSLSMSELHEGKFYLSGHFTGGNLTSQYEMEYNKATHCYETVILLKQGAYDYQYLWLPDGEKAGQTKCIEGDWYETRNEYQILLYYRPRNSRYDRLISTLTTCE